MPKHYFPKYVPIMSPGDVVCGTTCRSFDKREPGCLWGQLMASFRIPRRRYDESDEVPCGKGRKEKVEKDDHPAIKAVADECVAHARRRKVPAMGIIATNDFGTTPETRADIWNRAMARLGYTAVESRPCRHKLPQE